MKKLYNRITLKLSRDPQKLLRQRWIKALRSGKYEQTTGLLQRIATADGVNKSVGFCCLGVACEVAVENGLPVTKRVETTGRASVYYGYGDDAGAEQNAALPKPLADAFGLSTPGGAFAIEGDPLVASGKPSALYTLNDTERRTFSEIADVIESEPTGLLA